MSAATWDAIVIGAGPAGSVAACLLARTGVRVLLVERKVLPRTKVCGGCLNGQALAVLERAQLTGRLRALGARPVERFRMFERDRSVELDIPHGLALSRSAMDASLADAAVVAGASLVTETTALVVYDGAESVDDGWRRVTLRPVHGPASTAAARVVLVADGLAHSSLRECESLRSRPSRRARVGVGGLAPAGAVRTEAGVITMAVARHGYVGAVEVEDGRVNVAAAVDGGFLKAHASPAGAIGSLLAEAGVVCDRQLESVDWGGTIPLTRHMARPAARRLFVLGDAAGYVEPFTGEGMAWALVAAESVIPFASRTIAGWNGGLAREWIGTYARQIRSAQRWCRVLAYVLRTPTLVGPLVTVLRRHPALARPVLAHFRQRTAKP